MSERHDSFAEKVFTQASEEVQRAKTEYSTLVPELIPPGFKPDTETHPTLETERYARFESIYQELSKYITSDFLQSAWNCIYDKYKIGERDTVWATEVTEYIATVQRLKIANQFSPEQEKILNTPLSDTIIQQAYKHLTEVSLARGAYDTMFATHAVVGLANFDELQVSQRLLPAQNEKIGAMLSEEVFQNAVSHMLFDYDKSLNNNHFCARILRCLAALDRLSLSGHISSDQHEKLSAPIIEKISSATFAKNVYDNVYEKIMEDSSDGSFQNAALYDLSNLRTVTDRLKEIAAEAEAQAVVRRSRNAASESLLAVPPTKIF